MLTIKVNRAQVLYTIVCTLAIVWLPILTHASASVSPLTQAAMFYSNEVIAACSLVTAILGAVIAAYWKPPTDLPVDLTLNSTGLKFTLGVAGGIAAFFYTVHTHNQLVILHPVWVLGVSSVTPIAMQVALPILVEVGSKVLKNLPWTKKETD